jgi:hypothetical protein
MTEKPDQPAMTMREIRDALGHVQPDTTPVTDRLREQVIAALSEAGACCGECDFTPGGTGCPDCQSVHGQYADAALAVARKILGTTELQPCGSRSLPTYSGEVVRCVLTARHAGQCQSAAEYPYVSWPNPASGVWNREPDDATTDQQPDADGAQPLCGNTRGMGDQTYRPCARPSGHPEAYCRDASHHHHFLAAKPDGDEDSHERKVAEYLATPYTDDGPPTPTP